MRHSDELALIYTGTGKVLTEIGDFTGAAAMFAKSVPLAEAAAARNKVNMKAKATLASAYLGAGKLETAIAKAIGSPAERNSHWSQARTLFVKSADLWQGGRDSRPLSEPQARLLEEAKHEVAACDSALGVN